MAEAMGLAMAFFQDAKDTKNTLEEALFGMVPLGQKRLPIASTANGNVLMSD